MRRLAVLLLLGASCAEIAAPTIIEMQSPVVSGSGVLIEDIGIETAGGVFAPLLLRGCKVPCSSVQVFSTADDRQTEIRLSLLRGKARMAKDNHPLGHYVVLGVPPEQRGLAQVAVTLAVEGDRISLSAWDMKSNLSLEVRRLSVPEHR